MKITPSLAKHLSNNLLIFGTGLVLIASALLPIFLSRSALAAQISDRSLTISSGIPSDTADYTFDFTVLSATVVKSFSATACTTAVGSCTTPTGFSVTGTTIDQPINLGDASGWTVNTATAGSLRLSKSGNVAAPTGSQTVVFHGVTNPSTANESFFLRLTTYSDASWTTAIDTGTTASAVVQTLQVNAVVAEVLNFCIGSTTVNDDSSTMPADCTAVSGTSVNLGTLDTSNVNVTPVTTNCNPSDCGYNGIAMVRSNAINGTSVYYDAIQQSGTNHQGTLRISGDNCNAGSVTTDSCFNASGAQGVFAAGTEAYGMTIAGVNCDSANAYSCDTSDSNLQRDGSYDADANTSYYSQSNQVASTTGGFAWQENGTVTQIASSVGSATKVIDDEALILKFAATPSITTPFGVYTAQADFIAVSTY
jgi:hypothetical protein